jgi:flavodoxin
MKKFRTNKQGEYVSISRRSILKQSLPLPALLAMNGFANSFLPKVYAQTSKARATMTDCKKLVVYFTRSGNTRVIAEQLHRDLPADLFELKPATPYPADYEENVEEARREKEAQVQRPLKQKIDNLSNYDTIFLGFPIWGGTAPAIIKTFLNEHDLSGKTLVPFITHGKYGLGDSLSVVREHAKDANVLEGYSEECDQERDTMERVDDWLGKLETCPE